jgi:hypothetical protein
LITHLAPSGYTCRKEHKSRWIKEIAIDFCVVIALKVGIVKKIPPINPKGLGLEKIDAALQEQLPLHWVDPLAGKLEECNHHSDQKNGPYCPLTYP